MINLGLKHSELRELKRLLVKPHWIRVTVQVLDMDHRRLSDISNRLVSGQVNFDTSADVTRTAEMTFLDPNSAIGLNPNSPEDGALFLHRMIKIVYSVAPPNPTKWFHIPLFVGPVSSLERDGVYATIKASGKDSLGYTTVWNGRTFKKGHKVTDVMVSILRTILGETRYNIKENKKRIPKQVVVGSSVVPMVKLRQLARILNRNAFFDGRGEFQSRPRKRGGSVVVFNGRNITSEVKFTFDPTTIVNSVKVVGGKPKGRKKKVSARVVAPKSHPLSPRRLGRKIQMDGKEKIVPRYYGLVIEDSSIKTKKGCKRRAKSELQKGLKESVNVEFSALPWPLMEEYDTMRVDVDDVKLTSQPVQWSIPLTHDGQMSVGVNKKVSFKVRKKGKKRGGNRNSGKGSRGGRRG